MSIENINNQTYLTQFLNNLLNFNREQDKALNVENIQQDLVQLITDSNQGASISKLSKEINKLYNILGKRGSSEDIQQAQMSLRETLVQFSMNPDDQQMLKFVLAAKEYYNTFGMEEIQKSFIAALEASEENNVNLQAWWNTFSSIETNSIRKDFVDITDKINKTKNTSDLKEEIFNKLLSTVNGINTKLPETDRDKILANLFNNLKITQDLDKMNTVLDAFKEKISV